MRWYDDTARTSGTRAKGSLNSVTNVCGDRREDASCESKWIPAKTTPRLFIQGLFTIREPAARKFLKTSWIESGRVGSNRVRRCSRSHGSDRIGSGRVGSGLEDFKYHGPGRVGSGWITSIRSDPREAILPVISPGLFLPASVPGTTLTRVQKIKHGYMARVIFASCMYFSNDDDDDISYAVLVCVGDKQKVSGHDERRNKMNPQRWQGYH